MANPITGSKYDEAASQEILRRKFGTAKPLEERTLALGGGIGGMYKQGFKDFGADIADRANQVKYFATGQDTAVKPIVTTPSMSAIIQQGSGRLNEMYQPGNLPIIPQTEKQKQDAVFSRIKEGAKVIETRTPQTGGTMPRVGPTLGGAQAIMATNQSAQQANRGIIDGSQTAGIPFRNSTMPEVEKAKADYAKFMGTPQNTESYQDRMARWRSETAPYNPREREATRVAQARQTAQTEQANVAGEREAGIRQIEAEQKAKGEIGKATEAQRGTMELAKQQGINAKDAATIRAEVGSEGIDAKAIIAGLQSEDENVRKLASEKFMKMFGATASGVQEGATATGKDGKKIKYSGGKWIPA